MYYIINKDIKLTGTEALTEAGAWNAFFKLHPSFAAKSIKQLKKLGYAVRKQRRM